MIAEFKLGRVWRTMTEQERIAAIKLGKKNHVSKRTLSQRLEVSRATLYEFIQRRCLGPYPDQRKNKAKEPALETYVASGAALHGWSREQLIRMDRKATLAMLKHHPKLASADLRRALLKAQEAA